MGLINSEVYNVLKIIKNNKYKKIGMFGVQSIEIDWNSFLRCVEICGLSFNEEIYEEIKMKYPIDTFTFFKMFDLEEVHAIDYSNYEGADILFDLNNKDVPSELIEKFDMLINGGTLEHVFDIATALNTMSKMLKRGGILYHLSPLAGWVDHGFYSISPTFFLDYYKANAYQIEELCFYSQKTKDAPIIYSQDYRLFMDKININQYVSENVGSEGWMLTRCLVRKTESNMNRMPIQSMYTEMYSRFDEESYNEIIKQIKMQEGYALWGAGADCDKVMKALNKEGLEEKISRIYDSDMEKAGTLNRGFRIEYPVNEKIRSEKYIIIASSKYEREIYSTLKDMGVEEEKICKGFLKAIKN